MSSYIEIDLALVTVEEGDVYSGNRNVAVNPSI